MNLKIFVQRSLKTRLTLFTMAIFLIGIWVMVFYIDQMLRKDMERQSGEQQFSMASLLAAQINKELTDRLKALKTVAGGVTPDLMNNPAILQAFLEQSTVFQSLFNVGSFVTRIDGTAIAENPLIGRVGVNYMDRDHIAAALKEGKATFGKPVIGKKVRAPIFAITVPIHDTQGKVIGALAGITDLSKPNFLDMIYEGHYSKTGGYLIVARQYRLIVTATNKNRVMASLPDPGINPMIDRFIQGYEGNLLYINPLGIEQLGSVKDIPVAGWYVNVTLPTTEVFAPVHTMLQRILLATILFSLLAGTLIWLMTSKMLRLQFLPMLSAAKLLDTMADSNQIPQLLQITSNDEIGELIGGFNHLMETLIQREVALHDLHNFNERLISTAQVIILVLDTEGRILRFNPYMEAICGYTATELQGKNWFDTIMPEHIRESARAIFLQAINDIQTNGNVTPIINRKGEERFIEWYDKTLKDNNCITVGLIAIGQDITERKQLEEEVRQLAFYDTLTKLPNRRLLNDRLSQAMVASKRSCLYGALMFLDLDNFKPLNDIHGHVAGDLLLIDVAVRLKGCVREMDTVARFGGDEFVVMLSDLDADKSESTSQAGIIAEKIRRALSEPYLLIIRHEGKSDTTVEHHCTASIGVAVFIHHEANEDEVLTMADDAMYQAKEAGGNLIRFYRHLGQAGDSVKNVCTE